MAAPAPEQSLVDMFDPPAQPTAQAPATDLFSGVQFAQPTAQAAAPQPTAQPPTDLFAQMNISAPPASQPPAQDLFSGTTQAAEFDPFGSQSQVDAASNASQPSYTPNHGDTGFDDFQDAPAQPPKQPPKKDDAWGKGAKLFDLSNLKNDQQLKQN